MKYEEIVSKLLGSEKTKILATKAQKKTKERYIVVIDELEKSLLSCKAETFFFFRPLQTLDNINVLISERKKARPQKARQNLSQSQRKFSDFEAKLELKAKKILREFLEGDKKLAIAMAERV